MLSMRLKQACRSTSMRVCLARCQQARARAKDGAPVGAGVRQIGGYQAMTEQGIKKVELARRLGWHMPQVDRLFDLRHASRLDQIEAAAAALGRHIEVTVA